MPIAKVVCADCLHVGFVPRRSLPRMLCCSLCLGVAWHDREQPDADLLALAALDAAYDDNPVRHPRRPRKRKLVPRVPAELMN